MYKGAFIFVASLLISFCPFLEFKKSETTFTGSKIKGIDD